MQKIIVDPGFRELLFNPQAEERAQLEENILAEGRIRNPLVLWKGHDILLDGHNRWEIYLAHSDELPFPETTELSFESRDEAEEWVILNQLGQRNLLPAQAREYRGRLYKTKKRLVGEHTGNQYTKMESGQNEPIPNDSGTADMLGKQLGVGASTIKRDEKFVDGLDAAKEVDPEFVDDVRYGRLNPTRDQVARMAKLEPEQRKQAIDEIKNPKPIKFPSGHKKEGPVSSAEVMAIAERDARVTDKRRMPEYGIDDLIGELTSLQEDFLDKYLYVLDIRRDVALDDEKDKKRVLACLREFETKWKTEVKEIFK